MSNEDKCPPVRIVKEQLIPYGNEETVPMYRAVIAEQRAFLAGNNLRDGLVSLAYERTEAEAKSKAAAVLRRWAASLEFVDHSVDDPLLCSYCGYQKNSVGCRNSHP